MPFPQQSPIPFTESGIQSMNSGQAGCYGIFNSRGCIYVGQSDDIRLRLLQHLRGQSDQAGCIWEYGPTYCLGVVGWMDRFAEERRLIAELRPVCNLA
jgi:hypothetical protein